MVKHLLMLILVLIAIIVLLGQLLYNFYKTRNIIEGFEAENKPSTSLDNKCTIWLEKKKEEDKEKETLAKLEKQCPEIKSETIRINKLYRELEEIKKQYQTEKSNYIKMGEKINSLVENMNKTAKANHTAEEKTDELNEQLKKI